MMSIPFIAAMLMVFTGIAVAVLRKNIIKIIMGVSICASGINLLLISLGYRDGAVAPIFTNAPSLSMVLPTPQALTLTAIVIDLAVTAMLLSFAMLIYRHYGSLDARKRRLSG